MIRSNSKANVLKSKRLSCTSCIWEYYLDPISNIYEAFSYEFGTGCFRARTKYVPRAVLATISIQVTTASYTAFHPETCVTSVHSSIYFQTLSEALQRFCLKITLQPTKLANKDCFYIFGYLNYAPSQRSVTTNTKETYEIDSAYILIVSVLLEIIVVLDFLFRLGRRNNPIQAFLW